jgi:hypothetical protein
VGRPLGPRAGGGGRVAPLLPGITLLGQDPDDFSFYWRRAKALAAGKGPSPADRFDLYSVGFLRDAERTAAHKKAKVWLDEQEKKDEPRKQEMGPTVAKRVEYLSAAFAGGEMVGVAPWSGPRHCPTRA